MQPFIADAVSAVIGAFVVCLATFFRFRHAERLTRLLGPTGLTVVLRPSAFILPCIGVQIVLNGADALLGVSKALTGASPTAWQISEFADQTRKQL